jgi:hypothetical protein
MGVGFRCRSVPVWGRWGYEEDEHGDTEGLRDAVGFVDADAGLLAADQATYLSAGYPGRFGEAANRVGLPATWVVHDLFEQVEVSQFIAHSQWISRVAKCLSLALS